MVDELFVDPEAVGQVDRGAAGVACSDFAGPRQRHAFAAVAIRTARVPLRQQCIQGFCKRLAPRFARSISWFTISLNHACGLVPSRFAAFRPGTIVASVLPCSVSLSCLGSTAPLSGRAVERRQPKRIDDHNSERDQPGLRRRQRPGNRFVDVGTVDGQDPGSRVAGRERFELRQLEHFPRVPLRQVCPEVLNNPLFRQRPNCGKARPLVLVSHVSCPSQWEGLDESGRTGREWCRQATGSEGGRSPARSLGQFGLGNPRSPYSQRSRFSRCGN